MEILIGDKEYDVEEARTELQRRKGLSNRESLKKDEGMLFYYDLPQEVSMWMYQTKIPLDIIFINENQKVISVLKGEPNSEELITEQNVKFVLEVNQKSGIKENDELEFVDDGPVMKVLFQDGTEQMELWGGERIFRRAFTKLLIKLVQSSKSLDPDSDEYAALCKRIGKKMFKEINAQDNRQPEYVLVSDSKLNAKSSD